MDILVFLLITIEEEIDEILELAKQSFIGEEERNVSYSFNWSSSTTGTLDLIEPCCRNQFKYSTDHLSGGFKGKTVLFQIVFQFIFIFESIDETFWTGNEDIGIFESESIILDLWEGGQQFGYDFIEPRKH